LLDIEKIRQLVDMMVTNELMEVSIRDGETAVTLRRPHLNSSPVVIEGAAPASAGNPTSVAAPSPIPPAEVEPMREIEYVEVKSPMVGTFFAAPDPNSAPFVQVGSPVQPGTVVCIIEAMKVFNEIKAEVAGVVDRVLVKNAQPVEYGQPLFRIRPE
jgi:acetyl-CoA carboxylase biotin carboxyl carrier protein